jgi:hypothetical protein
MAIYAGATPAELTGFALAEAENELHLNAESLARFMPNENVEVPFVHGALEASQGTGMAGFRGWDVEPGMGKANQKGKDFHVDLAPVTEKGIVSEKDRMTLLNGSLEERTKKLVEDSAAARVISVGNRVEFARAQAIFDGKIQIDDNGFKDLIDFNRPAEASTTLDKLWSDPTTDPLDDLEDMIAAREAIAGSSDPVAALMSRKIYRMIKKSKSLRASLGLPVNSRGRISDEELNSLLMEIGIAEVVVYDHTYGPAGAKVRLTPEDKLVLLPTTVGINDGKASNVARTFWTRSSEAAKPNYGLAPDAQFGIVVGAFEEEDSAKIWTKADAVVAPAIVHPEYFFSAKVI